MKEIKVLIACGSGIATSTVAQEKVKEILKSAKISAKIVKGTIGQIQNLQDDVDLILVTTKYNKPVTKPIILVFGLISGIKEEEIRKDIIETSKRIAEEK